MTTPNDTQPIKPAGIIPLKISIIDALRQVARSLEDHGDGAFASVVRQGADMISELVAALNDRGNQQ